MQSRSLAESEGRAAAEGRATEGRDALRNNAASSL